MPIEAATGQGWEGGPLRGQTGRQVGAQLTTVGQVQGAPALHQKQGCLVLGLGAEIRDAHGAGDHVPGEGHELVGTCRRTGVTGGAHHPVGMAVEGIEQAAAEEDAVTNLLAVGPGPFGVADRVEQGPALRGDGENPWRGRQRRHHRDPGGGHTGLRTQLPGARGLRGTGWARKAQASKGEEKVTALKVRQEKRS